MVQDSAFSIVVFNIVEFVTVIALQFLQFGQVLVLLFKAKRFDCSSLSMSDFDFSQLQKAKTIMQNNKRVIFFI